MIPTPVTFDELAYLFPGRPPHDSFLIVSDFSVILSTDYPILTTLMYRGRRSIKTGKGGAFNPEDAKHVKHTKLGVWDFYQERRLEFARIPGAAKAEPYLEMYQSLPFVWRMLKELGQIKSCWILLSLYLLIVFLASLVPAVSLWYSGQLLKIVRQHISSKTNT